MENLLHGIVQRYPGKSILFHQFIEFRINKRLSKLKIWIRVLEDPKWFRACVHQITTEDEIDLLAKEIKKILT